MDPVSKSRQGNITSFKPGNPTRFAPGISGNPAGRPKTAHFTKIIKKIAKKRSNQKEIEEIMLDILRKRGMAAVLLLREMTERLEGPIAQEVNMNLNLTLAETIKKARERASNPECLQLKSAS